MERGLSQIQVPEKALAAYKLDAQNPRYPVEARQRRITGKVLLKVSIGTDGHVHRLHLVSSPDPILSMASVMAVQRWVYKPYLLNGQATEVETTISVDFQMY